MSAADRIEVRRNARFDDALPHGLYMDGTYLSPLPSEQADLFDELIAAARQAEEMRAEVDGHRPPQPTTERVPLHAGIIGRRAAGTGGAVITDYWTRDGEAFVLCETLLSFFVDADADGELRVEVLTEGDES